MKKKFSQKIIRLGFGVSFLSLSILLSGCPAVVVGGAATTAVIAQDRRTTGTMVEDQTIALKAKKIISKHSSEELPIHVSALSFNNNLLLVGQTSDNAQREDIEMLVHQIDKVRNVYNEITVDTPTSAITRSNDSWITAKIKSEMLLHREINPTHVKVITEN